MSDEPRIRYSIYKIADIESCRAKLATKEYQPAPLGTSFSGWELHLSKGFTRSPKWVPVLSEIVQDTTVLNNVRDTTYSFVLLIPNGDSFFAVCGGLGSFVVQNFIVEDFDLDIVSRVVDPDKIKYKRSKNFAGKTAQEESLYKEYYNYNFDTSNWFKITKEILGEIRNVDLSDFFGLTSESRHKIRLDGKNSLSINRSITVEDLNMLIEKITEIENNREYKFRILKGFQQVTDKAMRTNLNEKLSETLQLEFKDFLENPEEFQETNVGISYSDMKEFLLCDTFEIKLGRFTKEFETAFDLRDIFEFLKSSNKSEFHESYLSTIFIIGRDNDGRTKIEDPIKAFLYSELKRLQQLYFLVDSKWFLINRAFQTEVNQRFASIVSANGLVSSGYSLPSWGIIRGRTETEDNYVDNICTQDGFHKMHRDLIVIRGPDKAEVCDVVDIRTTDTSFVFLKRGLGSKLRELLAQTRSSAELYSRDSHFKKSAKTKIQAKVGAATIVYEPKDISWILAFTDHSMTRGGIPLSERLTTIVKTDVIHTFEFLSELDLPKIKLYEISHTS